MLNLLKQITIINIVKRFFSKVYKIYNTLRNQKKYNQISFDAKLFRIPISYLHK